MGLFRMFITDGEVTKTNMGAFQGVIAIGTPGSVLIAAAGIVITVLVATWRVASRLSEVSTKLDGLDNVQKLTGQIEMIDAAKAARIPEDISSMRSDIDQVAENASEMTDMASSVDTIERSVTNIDFEGIELAVGTLVDGGLPAGNSVEHELRRSGVTVVVSLSSLEDDRTEVSVRFEENVGARELIEPLLYDDGLTAFELERFETEPNLHAVSPRQLEAVIPSGDLDAVVEWVTVVLDRLDENYVELHESRAEFDDRLEEHLE